MRLLQPVAVSLFLTTILTGWAARDGFARPPGAASASPAGNFEVQKLADGVYAVIRKDLPGLMVDANDVFIVNDDDVIVVDTGGAPATTRNVLAALRKLTSKPVRYVVNTHGHDDHISGNHVYREAFPGVEFIGHARLGEYLSGPGAVNRKQFLEEAPKFVEFLKGLLVKNKGLGGGDLSAEERASLGSDIPLAEVALSGAPEVRTVLPTLTVEDRLTLHRGARTIEVRQLGRGHTAFDLVVHLPNEGIVVTGDLVVWPVPLVGSDQSYVRDWSPTLEKLRALKPAVLVPGHGPVLRDDSYVRLVSELFAYVTQQTDAAVSRGESLAEARKSVKLDDLRKRFVGDSKVRGILFDSYVAGPGVAAAHREASANR